MTESEALNWGDHGSAILTSVSLAKIALSNQPPRNWPTSIYFTWV